MFKQRKTKEQSDKHTTLTPTKILPKKQSHSLVDFQIALSTYKLDSQNKNYIYKIKTQVFFFIFGYKIGPLKKNPYRTRKVCMNEASDILLFYFNL